jgi:hypothetical protein
MIEAVENHMPEVIVIDEIGTELEAAAARTIAERGVQLVATAHGNTLENLMLNPTLADLVGGIQTVTLGDEEARRRGTQKSILERKAPPTFDVVVEIQQWDRVAVHENVADVVDELLRGDAPEAAIRYRDETGAVQVERAVRRSGGPPSLVAVGGRGGPRSAGGYRGDSYRGDGFRGDRHGGESARGEGYRAEGARAAALAPRPRAANERVFHVYPFGVNRVRLEHAIRSLQLNAVLASDLEGADAVITIKNYYRRKPQPLRDAEASGIPIWVLRSNTQALMEEALLKLVQGPAGPREEGVRVTEGDPLEETEEAIQAVLDNSQPDDQTPQNTYNRRHQHQLAERYNLGSRSAGREPYRHVRIYKP